MWKIGLQNRLTDVHMGAHLPDTLRNTIAETPPTTTVTPLAPAHHSFLLLPAAASSRNPSIVICSSDQHCF